MIEYNDIKDFIIDYNAISDEYITLDEIITKLEECIKETKKFEDTVEFILRNYGYNDDELIASLFALSKIDSMVFYLKIIKNEL